MKSFDNVWEEIHATQEWGKYPSEPVIRFMARNYYKKDRKSIKVLDFGCGGGNHTWYLSKEGFSVYAFDGSISAIDKVKQLLEKERLSACLKVMDALELDYEDNFFDCIIDNATIYANKYQNIKLMYSKIFKILKEGGRLLTVNFSTNTTGYGTGKELEKNTFCDITSGRLEGRGITHFFEEDELKNILSDIGFINIIIDKMQYTDMGDTVGQFLVQAEKPLLP